MGVSIGSGFIFIRVIRALIKIIINNKNGFIFISALITLIKNTNTYNIACLSYNCPRHALQFIAERACEIIRF